ncbi:hypothetical protein C8R44DRAFT_731400 [Mycena epipterygia]|nr:hypothetical protein C8R44DRAFT_731400 [Mycena epipterygia]
MVHTLQENAPPSSCFQYPLRLRLIRRPCAHGQVAEALEGSAQSSAVRPPPHGRVHSDARDRFRNNAEHSDSSPSSECIFYALRREWVRVQKPPVRSFSPPSVSKPPSRRSPRPDLRRRQTRPADSSANEIRTRYPRAQRLLRRLPSPSLAALSSSSRFASPSNTRRGYDVRTGSADTRGAVGPPVGYSTDGSPGQWATGVHGSGKELRRMDDVARTLRGLRLRQLFLLVLVFIAPRPHPYPDSGLCSQRDWGFRALLHSNSFVWLSFAYSFFASLLDLNMRMEFPVAGESCVSSCAMRLICSIFGTAFLAYMGNGAGMLQEFTCRGIHQGPGEIVQWHSCRIVISIEFVLGRGNSDVGKGGLRRIREMLEEEAGFGWEEAAKIRCTVMVGAIRISL